MKSNIVAAVILGLCLIVAALLFGGRYSVAQFSSDKIARLDRWTGSLTIFNCSEPIFCEVIYSSKSNSGSGGNVMNVDENLTTVDVNAATRAAANDVAAKELQNSK